MSKQLLLAGSALVLAFSVAGAAEKRPPVTRPPLVKKTDAKKKTRPAINIEQTFAPLAKGGYSERLTAFAALLPRAGELSAAARAEAARLRKLPEQSNPVSKRMLAFVTGSLDDLAAEVPVMAAWKPGLPQGARKVSGRRVDLTSKNQPVAEVLARAGKGWGVAIELSPAARRFKAALDLDLAGNPNMKEFLGWLAADQNLVCGHVGEKVVLVAPASVALKVNMDKAKAEANKK